MSLEHLFSFQSEPGLNIKNNDFVVQGLAAQPLPIGRQRHRGHGVHGGVGYVLEVNWNVPDQNEKHFYE